MHGKAMTGDTIPAIRTHTPLFQNQLPTAFALFA